MNLDNNKLIAEFIGRCGEHDKEAYTFKGLIDISPSSYNWYIIKDAKFDSSWDWLIIVIKKITNYCKEAKYNKDTKEFNQIVENQWKRFYDYQSYNIFDNKIEPVYKAVIEFIKWYNKNK